MQIVALAPDPSLGAALNMLDEWQIVSARDVNGVVDSARGASVVLIGVGDVDEGLDVARQIHSRGVTIPSLVVGEGAVPQTAMVPVLSRPFSLDDLRAAIDSAIMGTQPPAAKDKRPGTKKGASQADAVVVELRPQSLVEKPSREPVRVAPAQSPPPPRATAVAATPRVAPSDEQKELRRRLSSQQQPIPTRDSVVIGSTSAPVPVANQQLARRRGFGRRDAGQSKSVAPSTESPLVQRLRAALTATRDIEQILDELPVVNDLHDLAEALLDEARFAFAPQIASVYLREGGLFRIVASHGLSKVEQGLEVDETHPLFSQLLLSSEPLLIAPVDLARGLVGGIGGAHTEAMMVGPIHVNGECIAALVLGKQDFTDPDLDVLTNLAREVGPGLALARALRALRAR